MSCRETRGFIRANPLEPEAGLPEVLGGPPESWGGELAIWPTVTLPASAARGLSAGSLCSTSPPLSLPPSRELEDGVLLWIHMSAETSPLLAESCRPREWLQAPGGEES